MREHVDDVMGQGVEGTTFPVGLIHLAHMHTPRASAAIKALPAISSRAWMFSTSIAGIALYMHVSQVPTPLHALCVMLGMYVPRVRHASHVSHPATPHM